MIVIKNGTIVNADASQKADLLIDGKSIIKMEPSITVEEHMQVIDATGKYIMPGFIDAHTHFDLGEGEGKSVDDFVSGTKAAISGGTTTIIDFATQDKGKSLTEAFHRWLAKAQGRSSCHYRFHMAIVDWNDAICQEMPSMRSLGVNSFKMYMAYDALRADDGAIYACLQAVKAQGGVLGVHCENGLLIKPLVKDLQAKGHLDPSAHPLSRPSSLEAEAIFRLATMAQLVDYPVMVVHLSSAEGLEVIRSWRSRGVEILAETCPQYLFLEDSVYQKEHFAGAKYVISPPIRKKEDNLALIQAIMQEEIQSIATDHCSFSFAKQKVFGRNDFSKIPNGAPGVQNRGLLLYHHLVHSQAMSINTLVALLAYQPAKIYGLAPYKGQITVGSDADLVIFDPQGKTKLSLDREYSRCDYSLFEDQELVGAIDRVILDGKIVVEAGRVILENQGVYVKEAKEYGNI